MSWHMMTQLDLHKKKKSTYKIFDEIAPTYDFLNHVLSFGMDLYWRKCFVARIPYQEKIKVIDLATGTGNLALAMAAASFIDHITGIDLSQKMLDKALLKKERSSYSNKIQFQRGDATKLDFKKETFDLATMCFGIRNVSDPDRTLGEIFRVLKNGGRVMIMEFSIPNHACLHSLYLFYFRHILTSIGGLISGHREAYSYLNKSVEDFPSGALFISSMDKAGFRKNSFRSLTLGIVTIYMGEKLA